ncbi:hypothetical protein A3850_009785 [Lewinella sp. 4G2]|nr:hypothetical protein A3850_009785 [Lewinella sp. 4G2]
MVLFTSSGVFAQTNGVKDSVEVHRNDTIYFDFAGADVDATAKTKIHQMVADRPGDLELYIEGHTDAVGTDAANEALAEARCQAARAAMIEAGWPADKVELRYFGERKLAVPTQAKERLNRRVLLRSGLPRTYIQLTGTVRDEVGNPIPGGAIAHGTYLIDTVTADDQGKFAIWLPADDPIRLDVFARRHFIETRDIKLSVADGPPPPFDVRLKLATTGRRIDIQNLYFVGNKTKLLPGGSTALERLYHFMEYNADTRIELAGHVNQPGEPQLPGTRLHALAGARAKVVYNYLVGRGIEPERMRYRSYSNYEMVNPNPVDEREMRANRRVEIRVL